VSIQVQLLAQLDLVFPGLGDCFKDVLTPKSGHEGLRYCPDPVRVSRMGPDGLRAVMKTKPCRGSCSPPWVIHQHSPRGPVLGVADLYVRLSQSRQAASPFIQRPRSGVIARLVRWTFDRHNPYAMPGRLDDRDCVFCGMKKSTPRGEHVLTRWLLRDLWTEEAGPYTTYRNDELVRTRDARPENAIIGGSLPASGGPRVQRHPRPPLREAAQGLHPSKCCSRGPYSLERSW